jgi:hypothetical protein
MYCYDFVSRRHSQQISDRNPGEVAPLGFSTPESKEKGSARIADNDLADTDCSDSTSELSSRSKEYRNCSVRCQLGLYIIPRILHPSRGDPPLLMEPFVDDPRRFLFVYFPGLERDPCDREPAESQAQKSIAMSVGDSLTPPCYS